MSPTRQRGKETPSSLARRAQHAAESRTLINKGDDSMPYAPFFGTIQSAGEPIQAPKATSPFRIAVLGDFSGRQNRGQTGSSKDIAARRLLRVSRDTLDDVMAKLGVQL